MSFRAVIFEDDPIIRNLLAQILDDRDWHVTTFPHPGLCRLWEQENPYPGFCRYDDKACADLMLSDLHMPIASGLELVEKQQKNGCTIPHIGLMSARWEREQLEFARYLKCRIFTKPFDFDILLGWIVEVEWQLRLPSPYSRYS